MSFPRYPKYKPSGVEWLGEVPEHWESMPIRKAARLESGHTPSRNRPEYWENCTVPWFSLGDVWQIRKENRSVILETAEKISELGIQNSAARKLPPGTVMLSRTASVGFAAIMGVEMATTQDFANWVCSERLKPEFLLYAFRAMKGEFGRLMMGSTHNTIYMPDIQAFRFALPTRKEQDSIVQFLDRETAKIDSLVAEKEKLIVLLKEKRQAIISHAVTKGLNHNAAMKDSGIEWLGQIPAHWDIKKLRFLGTCQNGINIGAEYFGSGTPFVSYGDVFRNDVLPSVVKGLVQSTATDQEVYSVKSGDVLFTRTSETIEEIGLASVCLDSIENATFAGFLIRFRPFENVLHSGFSKYFFRNQLLRAFFVKEMNLVTRASLSQDLLKSLPVLLPDIEEQTRIAEYLDNQIGRIDTLVADAISAINILQERRSALISAAVTGQIDVRKASERQTA